MARKEPNVAADIAENHQLYLILKFKCGVTCFLSRYPMPLSLKRNFPGEFAQGFERFVFHKVYGRAYATKDDQYIGFEDTNANIIFFGLSHQFSLSLIQWLSPQMVLPVQLKKTSM